MQKLYNQHTYQIYMCIKSKTFSSASTRVCFWVFPKQAWSRELKHCFLKWSGHKHFIYCMLGFDVKTRNLVHILVSDSDTLLAIEAVATGAFSTCFLAFFPNLLLVTLTLFLQFLTFLGAFLVLASW